VAQVRSNLDSAAKAATGAADTDGWTFWSTTYKGNVVTLGALRDMLPRSSNLQITKRASVARFGCSAAEVMADRSRLYRAARSLSLAPESGWRWSSGNRPHDRVRHVVDFDKAADAFDVSGVQPAFVLLSDVFTCSKSRRFLFLYTYHRVSVSDLDRQFCHNRCMILNRVTPMHHLMIMVSSAASGRRRWRPVWPLLRP
jgi:hypothetical protein